MKKKIIMLMAGVMLLSAVTACGKGKSEDSEVAASKEGEVKLCDYSNLVAEKNIYPVTETDIQNYIEDLLSEYVDYKKVDRSAAEDDYVDMELVGKSGNEVVYDFKGDEKYESYKIGDEELGAEFDDALKGKLAGDEFKVSVSYDSDFWDGGVAGKNVDFEVKVISVNEEILPELTDKFVKKDLGYKSVEDMNTQIAAQLEAENAQNSEDELRANLLQMVVDDSKISNYSQSDYEDCLADIEAYYEELAGFYGAESLDDFYEMSGMSRKDLEADALNQLYTVLVVEAIVSAESLEISEEEYDKGVEALVESYEAESKEALIEEYGEENIRFELLREKVCDFLEQHATITEVEAIQDEEEE